MLVANTGIFQSHTGFAKASLLDFKSQSFSWPLFDVHTVLRHPSREKPRVAPSSAGPQSIDAMPSCLDAKFLAG